VKQELTWWRDVSDTAPEHPLLVVALADDAAAVSALPPGYAEDWLLRDTPTARVAEYLGVTIVAADAEPPEHDLLLLAAVGRGLTSVAACVAVSVFGAEPQLVTGYGSGITDEQWMDKVADVRSREMVEVPPVITSLVSWLENSEVPVLLDGVIAAAAASCADRLPAVQAPVLGAEPVQRFLLDRANVAVWGSCGVGPGEGLGALTGLAMLRLALLADGPTLHS